MDLNIRTLCCWALLVVVLVASSNGMTHECIPGKYLNPIVWVRPGEPVVLRSPKNFKVGKSQSLSCSWEVRPLWGSKLAMQVDRKDVNYNCNDNKLTVKSLNNAFSYKTACGKDTFPSSLATIVDSGPIIVSFKSNSNDGSVGFMITFLSVNPPKVSPDWTKQGNCSAGPCCQEEGCCVYNVGAPVKQWLLGVAKPKGFPAGQLWRGELNAAVSKPGLNCVVKLRAPPGFQVNVNFKDMDMLEDTDGGCTEDYVRIYENAKKTTSSLLGKKGLTFCGQHLPNSPMPSVFASSSNEVYIRYKTDDTNKKRGTGFRLVATAINPLVTMTKFSHQYGEKTCKDKCFPTIPPTPLPPTTTIKPCHERENLIYITNATAPHAYVANAKVKFTLATSETTFEFTKITNNEGLVDFSTDLVTKPRIGSGKRYSVAIITDDFIEKTTNVYLHCEKSKAGKRCPSCYFVERAPQPTTPKPKETTGRPGQTIPSGTGKPGFTIPSGTGKPGGTIPSGTGKPGGTIPSGTGKPTIARPGQTIPSGTEKPTIARPAATTPTTLKGSTKPSKPGAKTGTPGQENLTTGIPGVTKPSVVPTITSPTEIKYPKCGDKNYVTAENQMICDCTETKCNQKVKEKTGECEPCIDIPVKEIPRTTPSPAGTTAKPCPQTTRQIKIKVTNNANKRAINDALVTLEHATEGFIATTNTNEQGHAIISVNLDGNYIVKISKKYYEETKATTKVNCRMADGCACHVEVEAKLTSVERCKKGSTIKIMVKYQHGDPKKKLYAVIRGYFTHHKKMGKRTQIEATSVTDSKKLIHGKHNHHTHFVSYDVTGLVPNTFTFKIWNVHGRSEEDHGTLQESISFEGCPDDSKWTEACCTVEKVFKSDTYHPVTEITEAVTGPTEPTSAPCDYEKKDSLHINICAAAGYKAYGEPLLTLFSVDTNIMNNVAVDSIKSTDVVNGKIKCTGEYANLTLIKGFYPALQQNDMSRADLIAKIEGTNFIKTEKMTHMDCKTNGCQNCTKQIQILIKPKVCDQEFFTVIVKEATTNNKISGAKVKFFKMDGTLYTERTSDIEGIAKIQIDRAIEEMKLTISKEGFESKNEDQDLNCHLKPCGECTPELITTIVPPSPCTKPMYINVLAKDKTSGNIIKNAKVTLILQSSIVEAPSKIIAKELTNNEGTVTFNVQVNGTYQVQIKSNDYIDESQEINMKDCVTNNVTFPLVPNPITTAPPACTTPGGCTTPKPPCKDTEITFNIRDVSLSSEKLPLKNVVITVNYITTKGQTKVPVPVAINLKTDIEGTLTVPASPNGNYSYSLTLEGYLKDPTTGYILVNCDPNDCDSCKPTVNITVENSHCSRKMYPHNFFVKVTDAEDHSAIPGAKVILTLQNYRGKTVSEKIGKRITPDSGIVKFLNPVNGDYFLEVKQTNFVESTKKVIWDCDPEECQACNKTIVIPMLKEFCEDAKLKVVIKDSTNNKPVTGAVITVKMAGMDNGVTKHIEKQKVPDSGVIFVPLDMNGNYSFTIEAPGFLSYADEHKVNIDLKDCETYLPMKTVPLVKNNICDHGVRISLTWGKNPTDLDLYAFRMMYEDSADYCQTYYCDRKEQCGCTTFDTDNLYSGDRGAETITICCRDLYSYMLYVDDRTGQGKLLSNSDARLTLTSNVKDQKINLDRPAKGASDYKRYWIAGCLTTGMGNFKYIPVNQFRDIQPSTSEPLLCHNLVNTDKEEQKRANFPDNVLLPVSAIDLATHKNVAGVLIKLAAVENDKIIQQEMVTSASITKIQFNIGENGKYSVTAEKEGFRSTPVSIEISCNKTNCIVQPITIYLMKNLPNGDIRISLTYQKDTKYYLNLVQVNKDDTDETCNALDSYQYQTKKLSCKAVDLEWTSSPRFPASGDGNGDSFVLKNAASNAKYTYLIYVADIAVPDKYTSLTLSDDKRDVAIKISPPKQQLVKGYWIAGCLAIEGTSFNFVPKNLWNIADPAQDGRFMCHQEFTNQNHPAKWKVPPTFCEAASLKIVVKNTEGVIIPKVISSTTAVLEDGTNNQLKANGLLGNGVYTTKVEAAGYVTDNAEKIVKCDVEDCKNCKPSTEIILAKKTDVDFGGPILSVTSQTGSKLAFVIYEGQDAAVKINAQKNVISVPKKLRNAKITLAVTQSSLYETQKLNNTDAVFTLRYGESLIKLKLPSDPYHDEKYWVVGSLQTKQGNNIEFFSDNFYANELEVFGSIQRSIGIRVRRRLG